MSDDSRFEELRGLLCRLGDFIRDTLIESRSQLSFHEAGKVVAETDADTIYAIDKVSETAIRDWFSQNWPSCFPVEVVMEGIGEDETLTFPEAIHVDQTLYKCILDPIDGTRGIMYDKRSAWMLAGVAPQRGKGTRLSDIIVGAMTELPTSKQWRADQLSAVRGRGLVAEAVDVRSGEREPLRIHPSRAKDFRHGFASFAKFFPEGRALTARVEERLWDTLYTLGSARSPVVFDDQYISTGGQFYEMIMGHDRLIADVRPFLMPLAGFPHLLPCHPYDVAAWPVLKEAGVIYESPSGDFPDAPLDTVSPVSWIAYANATLADLARPVIQQILGEIGRDGLDS